MDSQYQPHQHEDLMYEKWEKAGAFNPDTLKKTQAKDNATQSHFSVVMPPPNANDPLHIGHAMFVALEDTLVRFHRMRGDDTVWIPGTDHAGIETQFVFEKKLKKQGKSRFDFDRESLFQAIWQYVQDNSDIAVNQLKKLGASADWSRFRFTLDPKIVEIVLGTFQKLHDDGLVYRDYALINYSPASGTAFSELELKHEERNDPLYYLKYGPFVIATVRPETVFRDVALAVNPKDERYQKYLGQTLDIPSLLGDLQMTVIADDEVDPEFGTGIMKVSPAHDHHDFLLGKKYDLPITPVIDFDGRMDLRWFFAEQSVAVPARNQDPDEWLAEVGVAVTEPRAVFLRRAARYHGQKVAEARKRTVEDFEAAELMDHVKADYVHSVSMYYKSNDIIEPLPLPQFFIKVAPLVKAVEAALDRGEVKVYGAGHDKILRHWLANLRDWNISRQVVWGIRMPIWYDTAQHPEIEVTFLDQDKKLQKGKLGELLSGGATLEAISNGLQTLRASTTTKYVVSTESPGPTYLQETDTFDTWFSSGQWPFATLQAGESTGVADQAGDFDRFYPTSLMETGYDILPFWVMRMLLLGLYSTQKVPSQEVYLHGLVRDQHGHKMSKSKGNVVNPLDMIEKYGADALRLALVIRSTPGLDKSVGEGDFKAMRNFTNKIWNAARYVTLITAETTSDASSTSPLPYDAEFSQHLTTLTTDVTQQLLDRKLGLAADTLYNEFWHWFCDQAIEKTKTKELSPTLLHHGLHTFLQLLHPFVPFVTEAIWSQLSLDKHHPLLITHPWPSSTPSSSPAA
jgi:valyl-tRNA synthetase